MHTEISACKRIIDFLSYFNTISHIHTHMHAHEQCMWVSFEFDLFRPDACADFRTFGQHALDHNIPDYQE